MGRSSKKCRWQAHEYHESWKWLSENEEISQRGAPGPGPVFFTICPGVNKDVESPWFPFYKWWVLTFIYVTLQEVSSFVHGLNSLSSLGMATDWARERKESINFKSAKDESAQYASTGKPNLHNELHSRKEFGRTIVVNHVSII
jgi:hypothetical protein